MSAEKPTEWLVDLLYEQDEPTTDETGGSDQWSGELDDAQRAELDATFAMLGEVRAAMPMEEPRASVRASILEAAHKQAEAQVAASAASRGGRRAPGSPRSSTESLWGGQTLYRAMSFAAVLCVLIGAGVIAQRMTQPTVESRFAAANDSVTNEVNFGGSDEAPAHQQLAALEKEKAPAPEPEEVALAEEENDFPEIAQNKELAKEEDPAADKTLAMQDDFKPGKKADRFDNEDGVWDRSSRRKTTSKPVAKAPKKELDSSSLKSLLGSDDSDYSNKRAKKRSVATKSSSSKSYRGSAGTDLDALADDRGYDKNAQATKQDSLFGGAERIATEEEQRRPSVSGPSDALGNMARPSEEPAPTANRPASTADRSAPRANKKELAMAEDAGVEGEAAESTSRRKIFNRRERDSKDGGLFRNRREEKSKADPATSGGDAYSGSASAATPAKPAPSTVTTTESKDESKQQKAAEKKPAPNNTTLADVERAQRSEDARQTLDKADAYLERGIGSQQERARALELKADALKELGRKSEADAVYRQLERDYPQYYKKENVQEKKKRSKKKSASPNFDFADEAMEQQAF